MTTEPLTKTKRDNFWGGNRFYENGKLVKIIWDDGDQYFYDGNGRLIKEIRNGDQYFYEGDELVKVIQTVWDPILSVIKITHKNKDGEIHCDSGPAVMYSDGTHAYFLKGKLHRIGVPAIIHADGHAEYWENDKFIRSVNIKNLEETLNDIKTSINNVKNQFHGDKNGK